MAVGGAYGTLSEIALALVGNVPVVGFDTWGSTGCGRVAIARGGGGRAIELGRRRGRRAARPRLGSGADVQVRVSGPRRRSRAHRRAPGAAAGAGESLSGTEGLELFEGEAGRAGCGGRRARFDDARAGPALHHRRGGRALEGQGARRAGGRRARDRARDDGRLLRPRGRSQPRRPTACTPPSAGKGDISAESSVKPWELPKWAIARAAELGIELEPDAARALDRPRRRSPAAAAARAGEARARGERRGRRRRRRRRRRADRALGRAPGLVGGRRARRRRRGGGRARLPALRAQGERVPGLLYWISQRVRQAHEVAAALDAGEAPAQVKRRLRMPSRAADRLIADARRAGADRLRQATCEIADLELASRGGGRGGAGEDTRRAGHDHAPRRLETPSVQDRRVQHDPHGDHDGEDHQQRQHPARPVGTAGAPGWSGGRPAGERPGGRCGSGGRAVVLGRVIARARAGRASRAGSGVAPRRRGCAPAPRRVARGLERSRALAQRGLDAGVGLDRAVVLGDQLGVAFSAARSRRRVGSSSVGDGVALARHGLRQVKLGARVVPARRSAAGSRPAAPRAPASAPARSFALTLQRGLGGGQPGGQPLEVLGAWPRPAPARSVRLAHRRAGLGGDRRRVRRAGGAPARERRSRCRGPPTARSPRRSSSSMSTGNAAIHGSPSSAAQGLCSSSASERRSGPSSPRVSISVGPHEPPSADPEPAAATTSTRPSSVARQPLDLELTRSGSAVGATGDQPTGSVPASIRPRGRLGAAAQRGRRGTSCARRCCDAARRA